MTKPIYVIRQFVNSYLVVCIMDNGNDNILKQFPSYKAAKVYKDSLTNPVNN